MNPFHVFPPQSEVKNNNTFRKSGKKPVEAEEGPAIPLQEMKDPGNTESLLLQIIEDTHTIPPSPANVQRTESPHSVMGACYDSRSPPSMHSQARQAEGSNYQFLPSLDSHSSRSSSQTAATTVSPLSFHSSVPSAPMRSIFPQFKPKLPAKEQAKDAQISNPRPRSSRRKSLPKLSLATGTEFHDLLRPRSVPDSVFNFPPSVEPETVKYSSIEELKTLWELANGQRAGDFTGMLNLRMIKTGPATFTFGNMQQPFYTLQTYSTDEIALSRSDPSNPKSDVPIMMMGLEDRIRREHPNDGLVTLLFSRLAAMLAMDQAGGISREYHLTPSEAAEVESDALQRAAAQESCRLSWNRNQRLYELRHPSLSQRNQPALVGAAGIPLSPVRSKSTGMAHITVSTPSSNANTSRRQPPTIIVTGPVSPTATEAAKQAANLRTSTLPVPDQDEPLASLDFGTNTLSISPAAVLATIPSLYAIDSLVAAMLAVAVSDEATNPILADMAIGSPEPSRPATSQNPGPYSMEVRNGRLVVNQDERQDTQDSMDLASQIKSAQKEPKDNSKRKRFSKFWNWKRSSSKSKDDRKKNQKIVTEEFDLEKYGPYRNGTREGQKLPGLTRAVLRILFFGLDLIVKGLTLLVKVLAWMLVNSTRCLTTPKL